MDAGRNEVQRVLDGIPVDFIQFHGMESPDFCASFDVPYIKTIPMGSVDDVVSHTADYLATASAFVFDSNRAGETGGTGKVFDWKSLPPLRDFPTVLAGGLTRDNVADGVRLVHPRAVDVASGVESGQGNQGSSPDAGICRWRCERLIERWLMRKPTDKTVGGASGLPDESGHFGIYGGRFVSETLIRPLEELEARICPLSGRR